MTLDEWIRKKGLSSQEFGDQVGLTQGYISRLRRGIVTPSVVVAVTIRNQTDGEVSVDDMLPRRLKYGEVTAAELVPRKSRAIKDEVAKPKARKKA